MSVSKLQSSSHYHSTRLEMDNLFQMTGVMLLNRILQLLPVQIRNIALIISGFIEANFGTGPILL